LKGRCNAHTAKASQIVVLRQELRHTKWLIDYNYNRVLAQALVHKGLASIGTLNVERILFNPGVSLPLTPQTWDHLHEYFEQVVYHNSLVAEYKSLVPSPPPTGDTTIDRRTTCANEIAAICKPQCAESTTGAERSLRTRIERLLEDLDHVKIPW